MNDMGHNEKAIRLAALAGDAQVALDRVAKGEADAIEGWLAYGAALNEGRALFPSDERFGQWVEANGLHLLSSFDLKRESHAVSVCPNLATQEVTRNERAAAMWAAANAEQFEEARAAGNARTVRGIHAKWKEIEAERQREEEARRKAEEAAAAPAPSEPVRKPSDTSGADKAGTSVAPEAADGPATDDEPHDPVHTEKLDADTAEPEDPATAKLRAEARKMTREALEEEWVGLWLDLKDERAKRKKAEHERDEYKARLDEALASDDMGRALGNAQRQRDTARQRMKDEQAKNAVQQRRINKLEALAWLREPQNKRRLMREVWPEFDEWEERAAIREFDGGMDRAEAEAAAYDDVMREGGYAQLHAA